MLYTIIVIGGNRQAYKIFSHTTLHIQGGLNQGKDEASPSHSIHLGLATGNSAIAASITACGGNILTHNHADVGSANATAYLLHLQQVISNCSQGHNV